MIPSLYEVDVVHVRAEPVRHEVRRRGYLWFVDLDALPRHGVLVRFESRDHAGDPRRSLRANVDAFLAEQGVDLGGGRVTMLTGARALGYVFNPLTLYWCHEPSGALRCVIAEVHNTYRQRHRYLLFPDEAGRAETAKEFYVSPFYPVDGHYRMSVPEPADRLALTITLHRPDGRPFSASVRGVRRPATRRGMWSVALRHPFETWRVRTAITLHGLALWRAGLPVQHRPGTPGVADRLASLVRQAVGVDLPVRIRAWDGSTAGPADGPTLVIRSRRALRRLVRAPGELGLARGYVAGDLDVEGDLADGLRQAWRVAPNRRPATRRLRAAVTAVRLGALGPPPAPPACEARPAGRLHTRARDRAVIAHHYDMSNEFYALLLDETMAYSSAYYTHEGQSLHDAQLAKLDLVCEKLGLRPGMRLLDVGCGWGSLILHAAERYGVHATGITLSAQQRDLVAKRIAERGLADRVEVRLQDYRDLAGSFDAVASIEMGEHVGEQNYPAYLRTLHRVLRPGGRLLLQQMSRHAGAAPGGGAFIEGYIAPDMHMRPMAETVRHLEAAGFEVRDVETLREHYVRTVRDWLARFESRWDDIVSLQGEQVARAWRLYIAGGALAFEQGRMGVDQFLAVR